MDISSDNVTRMKTQNDFLRANDHASNLLRQSSPQSTMKLSHSADLKASVPSPASGRRCYCSRRGSGRPSRRCPDRRRRLRLDRRTRGMSSRHPQQGLQRYRYWYRYRYRYWRYRYRYRRYWNRFADTDTDPRYRRQLCNGRRATQSIFRSDIIYICQCW